MHRVFVFAMLSVTLCLFVLTGCGPRQNLGGMATATPTVGADDSSARYVIDTGRLWKTCAARCMQDDLYGILTRKGCLTGCEMARAARPNKGMSYHDLSWCLKDVERLNIADHVEELGKQCRDSSNHLYRRRGCRDAVKEYYTGWNTELCVVKEESAPVITGEEEPLIAAKPAKGKE